MWKVKFFDVPMTKIVQNLVSNRIAVNKQQNWIRKVEQELEHLQIKMQVIVFIITD